MDHLKIKYFFGPIAIVFISGIVAALLSKISVKSDSNDIILVIFDALFIYWIAALVFNIFGFMKNRIPIGKN